MLLRLQRSQWTPSLRVRVQPLPRPSRDWRNRTGSSHRFNTDRILLSTGTSQTLTSGHCSLPLPFLRRWRRRASASPSWRRRNPPWSSSCLRLEPAAHKTPARWIPPSSEKQGRHAGIVTMFQRLKPICLPSHPLAMARHSCSRTWPLHPQSNTCTTPMRRTWPGLGASTLSCCHFPVIKLTPKKTLLSLKKNAAQIIKKRQFLFSVLKIIEWYFSPELPLFEDSFSWPLASGCDRETGSARRFTFYGSMLCVQSCFYDYYYYFFYFGKRVHKPLPRWGRDRWEKFGSLHDDPSVERWTR